jgi:hypothetical protein
MEFQHLESKINPQNDEVNVKQLVKNIINSAKYLKKSIHRLPKELLNSEDKQKLFVQYEELVDIIVSHVR